MKKFNVLFLLFLAFPFGVMAKEKLPSTPLQQLEWMQGNWKCTMQGTTQIKGKITQATRHANYKVRFDHNTNQYIGIWRPAKNEKGSYSTLYYGYDKELNKFIYVDVAVFPNTLTDVAIAKAQGSVNKENVLKLRGRSYYQNYVNSYSKEFTLTNPDHYHVEIRNENPKEQYKVVTIGECEK